MDTITGITKQLNDAKLDSNVGPSVASFTKRDTLLIDHRGRDRSSRTLPPPCS